ncbi:MAG: hypothetical protein E6G50_13190 [Actinobacteria bacterium]|nr:MAG: hypothetical protein E6G50_13190 [Actinomycetota bacterium]
MLAPLFAAVALAAAPAHDWTRFDYDVGRSGVYPFATGITASNAAHLQRQRVELDGTVDSSPIYLHDVTVEGARHDVFFVTTTYGKTLAIDAASGRVLWRYLPSSYSSLAGTYRITNATPVADPSRTAIYAAGPDGRIRKLSVADGHELWSTAITLLPRREKIAAALNLTRRLVIATTGGYVGDAPPYQGHVVMLRASTGKIVRVWNSLCSNRHALIDPASCRSSDSAIWARAGAVVEPSGRLLVATGNAPWNGRTDWGDSALELSADAARLLQNWTPRNQAALNSSDADLGSTAPALLGGGLALQGGKDGKLRLLSLRRMNGTARAAARTDVGVRRRRRRNRRLAARQRTFAPRVAEPTFGHESPRRGRAPVRLRPGRSAARLSPDERPCRCDAARRGRSLEQPNRRRRAHRPSRRRCQRTPRERHPRHLPPALAGSAAAHGRSLLSERRVGERLQRLVQRRELVRDAQELLVRVETQRKRVHLVTEPVESFEQCIELPVGDVALFHHLILGRRAVHASARRGRRPRAAQATARARRRRSRARRRAGQHRAGRVRRGRAPRGRP